MNCIFCQISSGEIPTKIISKSKSSMAFLDAFPLAKGHTLVIPKNHHEKLQDMSIEENSDLFSLVHQIIPKMDKLSGGTLVAIHNGREAGQEIPHVHVHLVPRSSNDSGGPIHCLFDSTVNVSESETNKIYEKLKD